MFSQEPTAWRGPKANAMEAREHGKKTRPKKGAGRPFRVTRYRDDNPQVHKSVPLALALPADWPRFLNYSARETGGRATLEAIPVYAAGRYCALLVLRPGDPLALQFGRLLGRQQPCAGHPLTRPGPPGQTWHAALRPAAARGCRVQKAAPGVFAPGLVGTCQ